MKFEKHCSKLQKSSQRISNICHIQLAGHYASLKIAEEQVSCTDIKKNLKIQTSSGIKKRPRRDRARPLSNITWPSIYFGGSSGSVAAWGFGALNDPDVGPLKA